MDTWNIHKRQMNVTAAEKLIWSIALPGFGQLLNGKYIKGIIFILLEFIINIKAHFNQIIMLSFNGKTQEAVELVDYGWILFYPCLYFFSMWDAFKDGGGGSSPFAFLPFAGAAFSVTVGIFYSSEFRWNGYLPGIIWLPMLFLLPGLVIGWFIQWILIRRFPSGAA
ncbi:hypothetical protein [Peribacillus sp. SCS-37]|uniref:hypothetical protein n=1 Tax=Paraperibacillus esterisolvens TaxID=3115296 RepID=UPI0039062D3D